MPVFLNCMWVKIEKNKSKKFKLQLNKRKKDLENKTHQGRTTVQFLNIWNNAKI